MRLDLIKPRLHRADRFASQSEDPQPRILMTALIEHQAGIQQDPEVLAHRWRRKPDVRGELTGATRGRAEQLDHAKADRVAQRPQQRSQFDGFDQTIGNSYRIRKLLSSAPKHRTVASSR